MNFSTKLHPQLAEHILSAAISTCAPEVVNRRVLYNFFCATFYERLGGFEVLREFGSQYFFHYCYFLFVPTRITCRFVYFVGEFFGIPRAARLLNSMFALPVSTLASLVSMFRSRIENRLKFYGVGGKIIEDKKIRSIKFNRHGWILAIEVRDRKLDNGIVTWQGCRTANRTFMPDVDGLVKCDVDAVRRVLDEPAIDGGNYGLSYSAAGIIRSASPRVGVLPRRHYTTQIVVHNL